MEKQGFEDDIRARLEGHASVPDADVWNRLNSRLETADHRSLIRSRNFYRAAAASLALLVVSYASWQFLKSESNEQISKELSQNDAPSRSSGGTFKPDAESPVAAGEQYDAQQKSGPAVKSNSEQPVPEVTGNNGALSGTSATSAVREPRRSDPSTPGRNTAGGDQGQPPVNHSTVQVAGLPVSPLQTDQQDRTSSTPAVQRPVPAEIRQPLVLPAVPGLPVQIERDLSLAYMVADAVGRTRRPVKQKSGNSSWMAVGYSAGSFQQQILAGNPDAGDSRSSSVYYGQNFGRLAVFTGLALTEQSYNNTSNLAYGNASARKALSSDVVNTSVSLPDLNATSTYTVNTQKRYLSLPVQAGWYVVDRKIKGMISAGVMSDYFLSSTISDAGGVYQPSVIRRGVGSSYAGWVFSGVAGTEWSWGVSGKYQVALSPGFRYALTPVYRKDAITNGKSLSADIGFRVRYFF